MTRTSKLIAVGVALLALTACGSSRPSKPAAAKTFTVSGNMTLTRSYLRVDDTPDSACSGFQGYSDIDAGTQVVVSDATGKVVAVAALGAGRMYNDVCSLPFSVPAVPAGAGPYSVEVAHRGKVVFTEATADNVALTLGDS